MSSPLKTTVDFALQLADGSCYRVRNFTEDDLPGICATERRAASHPWSEANFRSSVRSSHICVGVECAQRWWAHAVYSLAGGEAELLVLAVDPAVQGRGLASALMAAMEVRLQAHAGQLFLEVRVSNRVAIACYEAAGFNCIGERRNYYPLAGAAGGREDALIYAKALLA